MSQWIKRLSALVLAAALIFTLAGCGGDTNTPGEPPSGAMGRYVEEEYPLPQGIGAIEYLRTLEDGSLELFCNQDPDRMIGPWALFTSQDGGKTWQPKEAPWLEQLKTASIQMSVLNKDGSMFLSFESLTDEYIKAMEEISAKLLEGGDPDALMASIPQPEEQSILISPQGEVTAAKYRASDFPQGEYNTSAMQVAAADNGDYLLDCYFSLLQVDSETLEVKNTFRAENTNSTHDFTTQGDNLFLSDGDQIHVFSLTTGEETATIECNPTNTGEGDPNFSYTSDEVDISRAMTVSPDGSALYFADSTGIYRRLLDGSLLERVIDGDLTSLTMPTVSIEQLMVQENGDYLVLSSHDGRFSLLRYHYDETIPSVPTTELKVYSLHDNKNIRQAMGLFQRSNPDVYITYTVGMKDGGAATVSDALRTLSTQLLAGQGPDLLVLDGMPVESYIQKGVLLDLSDSLSPKIADGVLLENVANSFKQADGTIPAVPARFAVPMMAGTDEALDTVKDLTTLADWVVTQKERGIEYMPDVTPSCLVNYFYNTCSPAWLAEDGSVKQEEFSQFLTQLKRISDVVEKRENENGEELYYGEDGLELNFGALYFRYGKVPLLMGIAESSWDIAPPEAALRLQGEGALVPQIGQLTNVFIPQTVMGINTKTAQPEKAVAFLETILSPEVQNGDFEDGFPVNRESFIQSGKDPYPATDDGMTYGGEIEGVTEGTYQGMAILQVKWPSVEYMDNMLRTIEGLDQPVYTDTVVKQMVLEETESYFKGEKSLEDTVAAFTQKMNIYLSEQK